ncbi:xanthine dehydrogenase family protein molybdopterin-binding subunit [Labrys monachus]|uniref:Carbon-monoxide dehydrogenase large subunit n=1 Tax=Labrys monachus TaxID=217067 RepID=A0ABU0FG86_9HYPH|nr:xanthine dehydrogenase family protein molybdopterin-binding subunit [Labrys monachus]MDQ0393624.1 carbon-monoxide dehydrogenase large subunit [Labrys monachus]
MEAPVNSNEHRPPLVGIGQSVPRKEDRTLVRGEGSYSDDQNLPGQAYGAVVRSQHAHGLIRGIDLTAALAIPGVLAIYTGEDLVKAGQRPQPAGVTAPNRDGSPMRWPAWRALAVGKVRHIGEGVAFVVAESAVAAREAAVLVDVDIQALPAVTAASEAVKPGAPLVHDEFPGNAALDFHFGDSAAVAAAFAAAAHVTRLPIISNRVIVAAMEPRASLGSYDAQAQRFTLRHACQGAHGARKVVEHMLGVEDGKVRILTGHVGGSFGMKAHPFAEDLCVLHAARDLGRPVKWSDSRSESFLSDTHGRDHEMTIELALDADANFVAMRVRGVGNVGAYLTQGGVFPPAVNQMKNLPSVYRTPLLEVETKCVLTTTNPVGAYRGNGRPEANYYVERVIDLAALELGIDPVELRRRNHVRPQELPFTSAGRQVYDSGDFTALMDDALRLSDWDGFAARREESRARGLLRGRGVGQYLEVTGAPGTEMGGVRFEPDGTVTMITGTLDTGQGHASAFAQVLVSELGIPFDKVKLIQGDSDELVAGSGTGGSKSLVASGRAMIEASAKVIEAGRKIAAHELEAAEQDVEFAAGRFVVVGTDREIGLMDLAARLHAGLDLPPGLPATLNVTHVHDGVPSAFPNGCHVAEVEIDPETGACHVVRYTAVSDFGTIVNPMLVEGQSHGGVAQGIGQALMERTVFNEQGQLLTGSFTDYALPRAGDVPPIAMGNHPTRALTNPLGAKGCGEAGCAGSLTSVMNAVTDALRPFGIRHIDMPATPERIWNAIQEAKAGAEHPSAA